MAEGGIARLGYADGETVLDISNVNLDSKMKAAKKLLKKRHAYRKSVRENHGRCFC